MGRRPILTQGEREINQRSPLLVQSRPQILQVCISYYSPYSFADLRIPVSSSSSNPRRAGRFAATFLKPTRKPTPRSYRTFYRSMTASSPPRARDLAETSPYLMPGDFRCRSLSMTDGAARLPPMSSARSALRVVVPRSRLSATVPFSNSSQEKRINCSADIDAAQFA